MSPKDSDGMANSVDHDQTASKSTLFAQACLSENLGSLQYIRYLTDSIQFIGSPVKEL